MKSMILKTTTEFFKGDGVFRTDHLGESRLVSRSYRLCNGSSRFDNIGSIHCQRLGIENTGLPRGTKARAILSPVSESEPAPTQAKKVSLPF
ncbi:unnamed protein product [Thlaspi arvense]|uniref:Uncharacterized protein n=1 Tax=Thlaspi arvense TaxID=13288 RepID=A0AAU9T998_THLAR|nr:unnamed protein product [Thlaspi arvense]